MVERELITRNQIVNQLIRIGHGDLNIFTDPGLKAVKADPELFAHLIAWNSKKGEVRDSKVAFPVLALRGSWDAEFFENAAAHLCTLDPRNLVRACYYHMDLPAITNGGGKWFKEAIVQYIRNREVSSQWWDRTALQHKKHFKGLYALNHIKPCARAQKILFDNNPPRGSVFWHVKQLKLQTPEHAAGTIVKHRIPFLIAVGALGGVKDKPDIILALIERMSGNELIGNTKMLERYGVFENPMLKAAYNAAVERMKKDKKVSTLKAGRAAKAVTTKKAAKQLELVQEQRLEKLGGIEGDWLVLGDCSGSMALSIAVAKQVAGFLAKQVKGDVHLVFFNTVPRYFNVAGKTLPEIEAMTSRIYASGGTSIGCGLELIMDKGITVNGIAICSDGGDNTHPYFSEAYVKYAKKMGLEPTVYLYHVTGDPNYFGKYCKMDKVQFEQFELGRDVDYYSLPNLAATMRTSRYMLAEEILETRLLRFVDVFKEKGGAA